jgi:hypothetical protein
MKEEEHEEDALSRTRRQAPGAQSHARLARDIEIASQEHDANSAAPGCYWACAKAVARRVAKP